MPPRPVPIPFFSSHGAARDDRARPTQALARHHRVTIESAIPATMRVRRGDLLLHEQTVMTLHRGRGRPAPGGGTPAAAGVPRSLISGAVN
jgi:hypothetical protein